MSIKISGVSGRIIPCCWADCERAGRSENVAKVYESPTRTLHYLFCTERHLMYWVNSHVDYGNLPSGSRGMLR